MSRREDSMHRNPFDRRPAPAPRPSPMPRHPSPELPPRAARTDHVWSDAGLLLREVREELARDPELRRYARRRTVDLARDTRAAVEMARALERVCRASA